MESRTSAFEPSPNPTSFAGLLAALTRSRDQAAEPGVRDPLSGDGLADDIATISYENALRAHARYKPCEAAPSAASRTEPAQAAASPGNGSGGNSGCRAARPSLLEQSRKRASVTIRVSTAEFAQLQQRAAEAGLTVSAYLRSCTFEVEALRAQVKQALAELRSTKVETAAAAAVEAVRRPETPPARLRRIWSQWLRGLLPRRFAAARMAQA